MRKSAPVWLGLAVAVCAGMVAVLQWPRAVVPVPSRPVVAGEKGGPASRADPLAAHPPVAPPDAAVQPPVDADSDTGAALPAAGSRPPRPPAGAPRAQADTPPDSQRARRVLDDLQFALRDYRTAVGGNPVGTNAEITAALLGDNARQVKVALPEGAAVNALSEMCDPWGTPYFFHQLSATRMEIRSAGPDRQMWTADDVAL
jgi:Type II secretion system (T2SS), protein G